MGHFPERSPSREGRGEGGALGPWPRLAKVRVLGPAWPYPHTAAAALLLPLSTRPWLPWWRGKGAPLPYIKGPTGGGDTEVPRAPPPSGHRRPPPHVSLSPAWPREGLCRREISPSLHVVVLRSFRIPIQRHLLPQTWLEQGFQESS
jgi:hypothetical protein